MRSEKFLLKDLVLTFQGASEALEKSYRELQNHVRILTEELEREREMRIRLERYAAMGEMAMELAHEIRNPLASIELYASMIEGEHAEQIVRSVRLLNHSVTNILQFGKPIVPSPSRVSLNEVLEGIRTLIQPLADQKHVFLAVACQAECDVTADRELLHRMLLNLVLNALRETPTNGFIRITAGHGVTITVEDSGPGIPEASLARIFDPMFSTHRDGCGLGLPIVKRIVDCHNGTIRAESSKSGARFVIRLPQKQHNMEVVSEPLTCS